MSLIHARMKHLDAFFSLVEAFCIASGHAEATLSGKVFSDGKRIAALRSGSDIGVRRLSRAIEWLSDNWPPNASWPEDVYRPHAKPVEVLR
jgi:hypothetical protein